MEIIKSIRGGSKLCNNGYCWILLHKGKKLQKQRPMGMLKKALCTVPRQCDNRFSCKYCILSCEKCPITCVYALLPSKDQSTYKETFTAIHNTCNEHNLVPSPVSITCDFEVANHNAIYTMFGAGVWIQGCVTT